MAQPPARYDPPLPQTPMVDEAGGVTQPWLMYFIGAQRFWTAALVSLGITPQNLQNPPAVAGGVTAETAARIAADAALEAQLEAEAGARAAADASEAEIRRRDDFEVRAQNVALAAGVTDEKAARIAADALLVLKTQLCSLWAGCDLTFLPTSDPGFGRPWLDDNHLAVGTSASVIAKLTLEDGGGVWTLEGGGVAADWAWG